MIITFFQVISCFARPSNSERSLWTEMLKLKAEQKEFSMKDEFAAYSKIQRKINKLEYQLKDDSQSRMGKTLAVKSTIQIVCQVVVGVVMLLSVIYFRREPIVVLKGNLFPFNTMLRYPSDTPNSISTHMWVLMSNISIRSLVKPLLT